MFNQKLRSRFCIASTKAVRMLRALISCKGLRQRPLPHGWRRHLTVLGLFLVTTAAVYVTLFLSEGRTRGTSQEKYPGYRDCKPATKIFFLKTHKCASSTVQNVLLRYALDKNLTVALPLRGNYLGRNYPFHRSALWGTPWESANLEYDIFCVHHVFNYNEASYVMGKGGPGTQTKPIYFSILRDPVDQFVSLWDYAQLSSMYKVSLEDYALADKSASVNLTDRSKISNLGRNQMLFDFGLPVTKFEDHEAVQEKIEEVDAHFDLILMADRFEESMVLLRNLLCWTYADVTFLRLNVQSIKSTLSEKARRSLRSWLQADYALYDHFARKFDAAVDEFGRDQMRQELAILSDANAEVHKRCHFVQKDVKELSEELRPWGYNILGYEVGTDEFCRSYGLGEMSFLDKLRNRQSAWAKALNNDTDGQAEWRDPRFLDVRRMMTKDGKPDMNFMRAVFGEPMVKVAHKHAEDIG